MLIDTNGICPTSLLEGKWERTVGAVIVLAAKDSKELEGVCHGVRRIPLKMSVPTLGKEAPVSHRDVIGVYAFKTMRLIGHHGNGSHENG